MRLLLITVTALGLLAGPAVAQTPPLDLPESSQAASVSQRVGLTDLSVTYHRPAVRERAVWGDLVPYGEVWRAGANENTVLTLSTPARVGGALVPAGSYGLHMIPAPGEWTLILSRDSAAWGSFFYDEAMDEARVTVRPGAAEFQEHLSYSFDDPTEDGVTLTMRWEKLAVPIPIEVDTAAVVGESLTRQLRGLPGFSSQSFARAAMWCASHNACLDKAATWADRAVGMSRDFLTLRAQAAVLEAQGQNARAATLRDEAFTLATEAQMNAYGYELLMGGKVDEAIAAFRKNVADHPSSWNVYDSLGEALAVKGETGEAVTNYRKALSMVQDESHKARINKILAKLGATD